MCISTCMFIYVCVCVCVCVLHVVSRDDLTVQPWEALSSWDVPYNCDVRAGLQPSLHMCVDHSSRMFLTQAKDDKKLSVQVGTHL